MAKVAILGLGTVGSGVAEVLTKNADSIARKAGEPVEVKYILGRHDYPNSPFRDLVVTDFSIIENDPEVTVVAECIGGTGAARDYTLRALKAGKSVVTSNKEVVAECGDEFFAIAREKNLNYLYEASVGGGIPIIRPLGSCLAANEITEIYGILNGTTNYILTKMIKEGLSFDTALAQAQEKGYAEADPTADVEGFDACRKICILASLSFGRHIYPAQVPTQGIVVRGDAIGDVMFYGRGAGKLPTASAVSADIIDAVKHKERRQNMDWDLGGDDVVGDFTALPLRWYIRTEERDVRIGTVFGDVETVSAPGMLGETAVFTAPLTKKELDRKLEAFHGLTCLPVLE